MKKEVIFAIFVLCSMFVVAQSCITPPSDLVSWWSGDTDASDIQDDNNGNLINGATAGAAGLVNGSFSLDGVNDYVSIPDSDNLDFGTGDFSLSAWFNTSSDAQQMIVSKASITESKQFYMQVRDISGKDSVIHFSAGTGFLVGNVQGLDDGNWHNVVTTRNGSTLRIYVDGVLDTSTSVSIDNVSSSVDMLIGILDFGAFFFPFNGSIDEVQIFSRALSSAEILAEFNAGSAGKCKPVAEQAIPEMTNQAMQIFVLLIVSLLIGSLLIRKK